jgi:beta-phosphoglucomutase-like phosphatase (HAD superfamily)
MIEAEIFDLDGVLQQSEEEARALAGAGLENLDLPTGELIEGIGQQDDSDISFRRDSPHLELR